MEPAIEERPSPSEPSPDLVTESGRHAGIAIPERTRPRNVPLFRIAIALLTAVAAAACLVADAAGAHGASAAAGVVVVVVGWGAPWVPRERFRTPGAALIRTVLWGISFATLVAFVLVETRSGALSLVFKVVTAATGVWSVTVLWRAGRRAITRTLERGVSLLRSRIASPAAFLPIASILLSVVAGIVAMPATPGLEGFLTSVNVFWVLAVVLAFGTLSLELARPRHCLPTIAAFVAAFSLAPAIAYVEPRYPYAAKHIGVTTYIATHQFVTPHLDIYQAWPGMFSLVAMLMRGTGFNGTLTIARFWLPAIDLLTTLVVALLISRFTSKSSAVTLGAVVFFLADSIGQDYYSPQSAGFFLAFGVVIVLIDLTGTGSRLGRADLVLAVVLSCALAVTHQLSPFLAAAAVLVLTVFRLIKPWWSALIVLVPAAIWAGLNSQYLREYLKPSQFGHVTQNIQTRGAVAHNLKDTWQYVCQYAELAGVLIPCVLFLLVWYQRRDRTSAALALCALSPGILLFLSSYGNESSFRVALFALPWLCAGLARSPQIARRTYQLAMLGVTAVLALTYVGADLGLSAIQVVTPGQVTAERLFESAPPGSVLVQFGPGSGPIQLTERYPLYHFDSFRDFSSVTPEEFVHEVVPYLAETARRNGQIYLVGSRAGSAYSSLDDGTSSATYERYVAAVAGSRNIRTVFRGDGVTLMKYVEDR